MKGTKFTPLKFIERVDAGDYTTFGIHLLQDENGADHRQKNAKTPLKRPQTKTPLKRPQTIKMIQRASHRHHSKMADKWWTY